MIITIDGPTASGKTTLGKALAAKLHLFYLYSGALFRVLAYILFDCLGYTKEAVAKLSKKEIETIISPYEIIYQYKNGSYQLVVDGIDITKKTQHDTFGLLASIIGVNRFIREYIAQWQKNIAKGHSDIIVDGRDAGTYVFPNASFKVFITASEQERAKRLQQKQKKMDQPISFKQALSYIKERDDRDINREVAPLTIAKDAIVIDTTNMNSKEVLQKMLRLLKIDSV